MGTEQQQQKEKSGHKKKLAMDGIDLRCKAWSNESSVIETIRRKGSGYLFDIILKSKIPLLPNQVKTHLSKLI